MADDLTDALRAIIEPMKGELVSAAQAHYLASIREELADAHQHVERALELIGHLVPEDTEPHWSQEALRKAYPMGPPPDEPDGGFQPLQPKTIMRDTPQPGELWRFVHEQPLTAPEYMVAEVQDTDPVRMAVIPDGKRAGYGFRFDRPEDPRPLQLLRYADAYPEPQPGSARERMMDGTDTY
jgi:hypothetical protein